MFRAREQCHCPIGIRYPVKLLCVQSRSRQRLEVAALRTVSLWQMQVQSHSSRRGAVLQLEGILNYSPLANSTLSRQEDLMVHTGARVQTKCWNRIAVMPYAVTGHDNQFTDFLDVQLIACDAISPLSNRRVLVGTRIRLRPVVWRATYRDLRSAHPRTLILEAGRKISSLFVLPR